MKKFLTRANIANALFISGIFLIGIGISLVNLGIGLASGGVVCLLYGYLLGAE